MSFGLVGRYQRFGKKHTVFIFSPSYKTKQHYHAEDQQWHLHHCENHKYKLFSVTFDGLTLSIGVNADWGGGVVNFTRREDGEF
jgi:hypothetical protein